MSHLPSWALGLALAVVIALAAKRARVLSGSGALAAVLTGTLAAAAGWSWAVALVAYFVASSLLSRFRADEKEARAGGAIEKSGARDALQVVANGGVFAAMALSFALWPRVQWQLIAAGALAASAADTWATEIGVLASRQPRSILTLRPVATGVSGGVTLQGLAAGIAGAGFVAAVFWSLQWPTSAVAASVTGGVFGCLFDSLLGASLQSRRRCPACGTLTERRRHRCGTATQHVAGLRFLNNDGVNLLATLGGGAFGATVAAWS